MLQKLLSLGALAGRQPFCTMNHPFYALPAMGWRRGSKGWPEFDGQFG